MQKHVLDSYASVVSKALDTYKKAFRQLVPFKTDDMDQSQVSYEVTRITLDKLRAIADEKIGFVPKCRVQSSVPTVFRYSEIEDVLRSDLRFSDPSQVEQDKNLLQVIPIAVIKQTNGHNIFVARKAEKAVSKASPEKDKLLGYFGGHVREEDSTFLGDADTLEVFRQCLYREVKEEIGVDIDPSEMNPYCIWVRDGTKSDHHLAIVFLIERDLDNTRLTVDGDELVRYEKKGTLGTGSILHPRELLNGEQTDSWTRNIIESVLGTDLSDPSAQKSLAL